jgi:hypothetical protein
MMSALLPKADIADQDQNVRFTPKVDIPQRRLDVRFVPLPGVRGFHRPALRPRRP